LIDLFKRTYSAEARTPKDRLINLRIIGFFQRMFISEIQCLTIHAETPFACRATTAIIITFSKNSSTPEVAFACFNARLY